MAVTDPFHRGGITRAEHARRDVFQLARFVRLRRTRCALTSEVLRRARREDLERRRCPVFTARVRQPVAVGELAAVAFIADGCRAGTEHIAVAEPGAFEDPMTGAVHGVAAETGG